MRNWHTRSKIRKLDVFLKFGLQFGNEDGHVAIECKRVDPNDNKLNGRYVTDGVERFATGWYAKHRRRAFMLGYVLALPVDCAIARINARIQGEYGEDAVPKKQPSHQRSLAIFKDAIGLGAIAAHLAMALTTTFRPAHDTTTVHAVGYAVPRLEAGLDWRSRRNLGSRAGSEERVRGGPGGERRMRIHRSRARARPSGWCASRTRGPAPRFTLESHRPPRLGGICRRRGWYVPHGTVRGIRSGRTGGAGHVDSEYHAVGSESVAETVRVQGCTDVELISLEGWVVRQVVLIRGAPGFRAVEGV